MKISILGTGYVGLSTGVCLADIGHKVICIDLDPSKIKKLQQGISPIYEPGINELIKKNIENGKLSFTISHKDGLKDADIIIIAVGTPQAEDGTVNLSYLNQAAIDIAGSLTKDTVIIIKSTVPVGTNEYVENIIKNHLKKNIRIDMISNPEFLREGSAIWDTMHADRIVIGYNNQEAAEIVKKMYQPLNVPYVLTSIKSAETIKYAANAFLATKISFINEIANLCEKTGANITDVVSGMGMDKRIGEAFLQAGIGYGGSCFPKDVQAMIHTAQNYGVNFKMLKETVAINNKQQLLLVDKAKQRFGDIASRKFAILGLAFKPNTDDMREAPAIKIIETLKQNGANVSVYDPVAMDNAKNWIKDEVEWSDTIEKATLNSDAILIVTEWDEIKYMDVKTILPSMKQPIIFDGRNCIPTEVIENCSEIEYYPVGKPAIIRSSQDEIDEVRM